MASTSTNAIAANVGGPSEFLLAKTHVNADGRDVYNFSPGPCQLPRAVLAKAQEEMFNYKGSGQSVMELTHRQDEFRHISNMTKAEIRKFLRVPDNFRILLQQGGATMQYTAVVKNLIGRKPKRVANLLVTGLWTTQNYDEISKHCNVNVVASTVADNGCTKMVPFDQWKVDPEGSFFHFCSNETVNGFEFNLDNFPWHLIPKDMPLVADMSSNIGSFELPWERFAMVYMGSQKNLGTAGCTVMVIREDMFGHAEPDCPILCDWTTHENSPDTYYNTPAIFPMYITGLFTQYMNAKGGLDHYIDLTNRKGSLVWGYIDSSDGFYSSKITDKAYRSRINACFRVGGGNEALEAKFIEEAKKVGIVQVKGHSFNPGIRASMYNSMPMEGAEYLVEFMKYFKAKYGGQARL